MVYLDEACDGLAVWTEKLADEVPVALRRIRAVLREGGDEADVRAAAEMELESVLRLLDELNEAAGLCLAGAREGDLRRPRAVPA